MIINVKIKETDSFEIEINERINEICFTNRFHYVKSLNTLNFDEKTNFEIIESTLYVLINNPYVEKTHFRILIDKKQFQVVQLNSYSQIKTKNIKVNLYDKLTFNSFFDVFNLKKAEKILFSFSLNENLETTVDLSKREVKSVRINDELVFGRKNIAHRNFISINQPTISKIHAKIKLYSNNEYIISDYNSHFGTYVNGKRIDSHYLVNNDIIQIGNARFKFVKGILYFKVNDGNLGSSQNLLVYKLEDTYLKPVSFSVMAKEVVAIIGPSGSGKSTLNSAIINTNTTNTKGVIEIGKSILNKSWLSSVVGYVPQNEIFHDKLNAKQCLLYYARLRLSPDLDINELEDQVANALKSVKLLDINSKGEILAEIPIFQLSGGQQKRVNIALELLCNPKILILDEPTSGLDPLLEKDIMSLLNSVANKESASILVTTHATQSIISYCDKVIVLAEGGYLVFFGKPNEVFDFFNVEEGDWVSIFQLLTAVNGNFSKIEKLANDYHQSKYYKPQKTKYLQDKITPKKNNFSSIPFKSIWNQFIWQSLRLINLKSKDNPKFILFLIVSSVILLKLFVFTDYSIMNTIESRSDIQRKSFIFSFLCFLYGLVISQKDIVGERLIYERERIFKVSILSYILSKYFVNIFISFFITLIITSLLFINLLSAVEFIKLLILGLFTMIFGVFSGLFASSVSGKSIENALYISFSIVLMQLIGSGIILKPFPIISDWLIPVRWSTIEIANVVHIDKFCNNDILISFCKDSIYKINSIFIHIFHTFILFCLPLALTILGCTKKIKARDK